MFDARLRRSLCLLLTNPQEARETRLQQASQGLNQAAWLQAQLRAKDGGLTLTGAETHGCGRSGTMRSRWQLVTH